jgi:hypothetical protein
MVRSPSYQPSYREGDSHNGSAQTRGWSLTAITNDRVHSLQRNPSPPIRTRADLEEKVAAQRELIATLKENCRLLERMQVQSVKQDVTEREAQGHDGDQARGDLPGRRSSSPAPAAIVTNAATAAAVAARSRSPPLWSDTNTTKDSASQSRQPRKSTGASPTPSFVAAAARSPRAADRSASTLISALAELVDALERLDSVVDAGGAGGGADGGRGAGRPQVPPKSMPLCPWNRTYVRTHVHTCLDSCMHERIHAKLHACMHTSRDSYIHEHAHGHIRLYMKHHVYVCT